MRQSPHSPNHVFEGIAERGPISVGWFYGFKLYLVANDRSELLSCCLTVGNVDDRQPVPRLVRHLFGKLFDDKGYLSQPLARQLFEEHALQLITKPLCAIMDETTSSANCDIYRAAT